MIDSKEQVTAKELMIGNFVFFKDDWFKDKYAEIICIQEHCVLIKNFVGTPLIKQINPIPITPQLLSMIEGFKEIGSTGDFYNEEINVGISKDEEGNLSLYNNHDLEVHPHELKYLHQLQNIIFCLSGNELKLTL